MKLRQLTRLAGLGICVLAFSGTASANNGGGKSEVTPPGQAKKAEQAQPAANSESQSQQGGKAEGKPEQAKAAKAAKAAPSPAQSQGRSADAHHHVIVCHRTGSESNPYVVINIPWTAWTEAHSPDTGSHPPLNGRRDILLKDPASRPGSKDGFTKASCLAAAGLPPQQPQVQPQAQPQPTDVCPNIEGMQTTVPVGLVKDSQGNCVAPTVVATTQTAPAGEVKGAVSPSVKASAKAAAKAKAPAQAQPAAGVLGATASAPEAIEETGESGTLPFTGVPVWFIALVGAGLLLTGLALRRSHQH